MKYSQKTKQTSRSFQWGVGSIFLLFVVASVYLFPARVNTVIQAVNTATALGFPTLPEQSFNLGLDLRGGAQLTYQAKVDTMPAEDRTNAVEGVRDVIERRVNSFGVGEPNVQTTKVGETYRILVELPGITDSDMAAEQIGETPILEFYEKNTEPARSLTKEEQAALNAYNADAKKRIEAISVRLKKGEEFSAVATETSEDESSQVNGGYVGFVGPRGTSANIHAWAAGKKQGQTSTSFVTTTEGYSILRRGGEQDGEDLAKASHILVCYSGVAGCPLDISEEEAKIKAEELFKQATASNFAALAKDSSVDSSTNEQGGQLPLFGKDDVPKEFSDAVFATEAGHIVGPVKTANGYHLIFVQDRMRSVEFEISRILVRTKTETDIVPPPDEWKPTGLAGAHLRRAEVVTDQTTGAIQVSLQFNDEGTQLFKSITEKNIGKPVAIMLDGEPISTPVVNVIIPNGQAVITGNFSLQEAKLLSQRLNTGALPVPIELLSQQTIGSTLGADSLMKSLKAGSIAVLLVALFLILYYRLPGLIATITMVFYVVGTLAVLKLFGATLTLAGITGLILSIGMAVDANVLIFERLKEELRKGIVLRAAMEEGFARAWSSIRDGNNSTLITCFFLYTMGTGFVRGFAITLAVGILVSMFTAIVASRVLLRLVAKKFPASSVLYLGYKKTNE